MLLCIDRYPFLISTCYSSVNTRERAHYHAHYHALDHAHYHTHYHAPDHALDHAHYHALDHAHYHTPDHALNHAHYHTPDHIPYRQRQYYYNTHLRYALNNGYSAKFLMNCYFERRWEQDIDEFRKEFKIETPPKTMKKQW